MTSTHVSRLIYLNLMLMFSLLDWLINYFQPQHNAGNWLAAAFGAFVIRFALPKIPFGASVLGWLVAFIISCLFAPDVIAAGGILHIHRTEGNFAAVALIGDLSIQLVAWIIRLSQKVGGTIYEHPGASFDEGLERVEKVTNVWLRIKAPLLDLISSFSTLFSKKQP
ncbi:hypothetical protein [Spirosoma aerophilum]